MYMHLVAHAGTPIGEPYVQCGRNSLRKGYLDSLWMMTKVEHQRASRALSYLPCSHETFSSLHCVLCTPGRLSGSGVGRAAQGKWMHLR